VVLYPLGSSIASFELMTSLSPAFVDYTLPESYHAIVLLIDDQAFVSDAVRRAFLHQSDIDYHYCASPLESVTLATNLKPSVILLDLVMPEISGIDLLKQFRATPATRETPIVVLSSKEEARTKSEAFAMGANDYLVKLPDTVELRARVRYHSKAHLNRVQREEAFRALRESQQQLVKKNAELYLMNQDHEKALAGLRHLRRLVPVCGCCGQFREDPGFRKQAEGLIFEDPSLLPVTDFCPDCHARQHPEPHSGDASIPQP